MSGEPLPVEVRNVAMKDPEHMKRWLEASGRRFILLDALQLVDALPWPSGIQILMQVLDCYRDHRRCIPTGELRVETEPTLGTQIEVPMFHDELLSVPEMDRAIRYFIRQLSERDATWGLENQPL